MALHVQQRTFSNVGGSFYLREDNEDVLHHITLIVATGEGNNQVQRPPYQFPPIFHCILSNKSFCDDIVKMFLNVIKIPQIFFNGRDCTMVENLSRMLRTEILLQPHHQHEDRENYLSVIFVMLEGCCRYKVVKSSQSLSPSFLEEEIMMMSDFDIDECSFPAGASAVQRLKIEDEDDDNCAICLQELVTGSDAARLPCSHLYHHTCIMQWFVECGTCPVCRYHCR